jgi:salicylate biosynthesis isochorismate synthase/menaquinone-specific isochorismate synthase
MAGDRWFCWEQPDRDGFALATVGTAAEVVTRGHDRFREAGSACAEITGERLAEEPPGLPAGAGPVWVGGFAFDPAGGAAPEWSSFPPGLLTLPEISLLRRDGRTFLTVAAMAADAVPRLRARLSALESGSLPLTDPHLTGRTAISSALPPHRYETAVAGAVERIRAGELKKVVLAREVVVDSPAAHEPAPLYGAIRELFPSCFCFCCGTGEGAFIGASPELLVRREGATAATVALAGSTRRSADPAVDDHLGERLLRSAKDRSEHDIVARRIERALRPHSIWVGSEPEPQVVRVANIQHLATPIHAQLSEPRSAVELAGLLHPTPAVGGEPRESALPVIGELEGMDRGWYAGPVGWMDASEDGEMCVALRSALLRDRRAHLYAGAGIVAGSDPAAELAETELKLDALLPLLTG